MLEPHISGTVHADDDFNGSEWYVAVVMQPLEERRRIGYTGSYGFMVPIFRK